jgi:hypothetical protein|nr:MAG TPA: hypothetical protein [Caudoviricetes sp.]
MLTRINDKDPAYWCRQLIRSIIVFENAHTVDEVLNGKSGQRYFKVSKQLLGEDTVREMIQHELDNEGNLWVGNRRVGNRNEH